jgi:hypothetical protein
MGYYMRFLLADEEETTIDLLEAALQRIDPAYSIAVANGSGEEGELRYNEDVYGEIEINRPDNKLFGEELEELKEEIEESASPNLQRVLDALDDARAMVVVRVLWGGRESDDTLEKIGVLWDWLLANRRGLLQTDEGYSDGSGLILEVEG